MKTMRYVGLYFYTLLILSIISCNDKCLDSTKSGETPEVPELYKVPKLRFVNQIGDTVQMLGPNLETSIDYVSNYSSDCGTNISLKCHQCFYLGAYNFIWRNTADFKNEVLYGFTRIQFGDYFFTLYPDMSLKLSSDQNTRYVKHASLALRGKMHNQVTEIRTSSWHYTTTYREDSAAIYLSGDTILRIVDYADNTLLDRID